MGQNASSNAVDTASGSTDSEVAAKALVAATDSQGSPAPPPSKAPALEEEEEEKSPLSIRFERTLFCGDITYQYEVSCNVQGIASWTLRLTVEQLTAFYTDTFQQWEGCHDAAIPDQHGKVMRPQTFTQCLQRVLDVPAMLRSPDKRFGDATADLLAIPPADRPVLLYDAEAFETADPLDVATVLDDEFGDKCQYLSGCSATYSAAANEGDEGGLFAKSSVAAPSEEAVASTSCFVRVLPQKMDLLVTFSSTTLTVLMASFTSSIAEALLLSVGPLDADCAWIIADYLPKRLFLDTADRRCNARVIYKADSDGVTTLSDHIASWNLSAEHLHALCERMQSLYRSQSSDESISEWLESTSSECLELPDDCGEEHIASMDKRSSLSGSSVSPEAGDAVSFFSL